MKKIDIKNKLIMERNLNVQVANRFKEESQQCQSSLLKENYKTLNREWLIKAEVLEEVLYHAFDYKFDNSIYTKHLKEENIENDSMRWKRDIGFWVNGLGSDSGKIKEVEPIEWFS